ncbi:MAG: DUF6151 family protein [Ruegeria sp.]
MTNKTIADLSFSCDCGAFAGHITAAGVKSGTHVVCYCPDCRAGELYFEQPDPAPGPVDIFQMSPDAIEIEKGAENLAAMRLGPNGMYRWYAKCCNSPIATSMTTPQKPFAGFSVRRIADAEKLGPVVTKGSVPNPDGKRKHENVAPAAWALLKRIVSSRVSGRWRKNPFFDTDTGQPIVEPKILTKSERAALYD